MRAQFRFYLVGLLRTSLEGRERPALQHLYNSHYMTALEGTRWYQSWVRSPPPPALTQLPPGLFRFAFLCPLPLSLTSFHLSRLFFCLFLLSVYSLCISTLCLLSVSFLCLSPLCLLSVSSLYIFPRCLLSVSSLCLSPLSLPSVSSFCLFLTSLPFVSSFRLFLSSLPFVSSFLPSLLFYSI